MTNNMTAFSSRPVDGRKSFYNKCSVRKDGDALVLRSYNTDVAAVRNGRFIRLWGGYSVTTMRHVNAFCAYFGYGKGGKKWWDSLPVERR